MVGAWIVDFFLDVRRLGDCEVLFLGDRGADWLWMEVWL